MLATGYAMPDIVHSTVQTVSSSWAIATSPQPQNIWKDAALIWENSKHYLYARTTPAGRIIIGGEDSDEIIEPEARDRLIPEKSRVLAQRLAALWPRANTDIEFRWSGTFDTTSDGLPLIGPVPGDKGVYAAYGYGGNGITFSFLAAQLIGDLIAGSTSPLLRDFAIDRDGTADLRANRRRIYRVSRRLRRNRKRGGGPLRISMLRKISALEFARLALETPVSRKQGSAMRSSRAHHHDPALPQPLRSQLLFIPATAAAQTAGKPMTTASGLQIIDSKEGTGASPKSGQTCVMHYTGWLYENGQKGKKFDSSVDRNEPFEFPIGQRKVIAGWDEGVATMKVGGKRTLIIPPNLGYGARGAGGAIPPNATLMFDVELLAVK